MTARRLRQARAQDDRRARGFTLLEVLVAFTLLALAMAILMQVFSRGINNADLADRYARATMYAESKLAVLGVEEPLQEGEAQGNFDDDYAWKLTVRAYRTAEEPVSLSSAEQAALATNQATTTLGTAAPRATMSSIDFESLSFVRLYEVELAVVFRTDGGAERAVALTTLKLGPRT